MFAALSMQIFRLFHPQFSPKELIVELAPNKSVYHMPAFSSDLQSWPFPTSNCISYHVFPVSFTSISASPPSQASNHLPSMLSQVIFNLK